MSPDRNEEIRRRLQARLKRLKRAGDYVWLAEKTGESRGQVWKWTTGATKAFPATFAATLEEAGVVAARWLLTEEGPEDPGQQNPEENAVRLQVIGKIADGKISPEALRAAEGLHRLESREDLPAEMRAAIAKAREIAESTLEAQS